MAARQPQRRPVVVLYERIVEAIQQGIYPPGSLMPSEPKLAADLGVSRPALREALILLQEDGVIDARRGVGRTVNHLPQRGFEQLRPMEQLLGGGRPMRATLLRHDIAEPTDFSAQHLLLSVKDRVPFWEVLLELDGLARCLAQEWAAPQDALRKVLPELADALREPPQPPSSMLKVLLEAGRELPLRGASTVVASMLGQRRGRQLGRDADTPALLATQVVRVGSVPVLAAKYLLPSGTPALPIMQAR
ncbi:GntR family transcriptional regulator [Streptomyces antimycoticus]|uniref:GntR family transcriptional regulator n=1 Tax=Streptomyces antimycoticus TaxID=68175 RepID=UPI000A3B223A|nr:GntR family transcriptional regulator [Streptomyces antimycoticus]